MHKSLVFKFISFLSLLIFIMTACSTQEEPAGDVTVEASNIHVTYAFIGQAELQVVIHNTGDEELLIDKDRATSNIRALEVYDQHGKRMPTIPPPFPISGDIKWPAGQKKQFTYSLDMFSPALPRGQYTIELSFVDAEPIGYVVD